MVGTSQTRPHRPMTGSRTSGHGAPGGATSRHGRPRPAGSRVSAKPRDRVPRRLRRGPGTTRALSTSPPRRPTPDRPRVSGHRGTRPGRGRAQRRGWPTGSPGSAGRRARPAACARDPTEVVPKLVGQLQPPAKPQRIVVGVGPHTGTPPLLPSTAGRVRRCSTKSRTAPTSASALPRRPSPIVSPPPTPTSPESWQRTRTPSTSSA